MKAFVKNLFLSFFWLTAFLVCIGGFLALVLLAQIPSKKEIQGCLTTKLFQVELCPGSKNYVPLSQISNALEQAVILTEDGSFYSHNGFDLDEIKNSLEKNIATGRLARGGSTITQQLAKNMFLTNEKTLTRKAFEALITLRIEESLSKKQILERYLNVVQFGKNIFGVKQAAQFYFKKHPSELNHLEAAWLALLLPNPPVYSRSFYRKSLTPFATRRITQILTKFLATGRITQGQFDQYLVDRDYLFTGSTPPPLDLELDATDEETVPELEL